MTPYFFHLFIFLFSTCNERISEFYHAKHIKFAEKLYASPSSRLLWAGMVSIHFSKEFQDVTQVFSA